MTLRRATPADLPRLLPLVYATDGMPQWSESVWSETFASPTRTIWLAEQDPGASILGFCVGSLVAGIVELETIAVSPAARRQGIARVLIAALIAWATEHAATEIELEVRVSNTPAIGLYVSSGFKEQGRRSAYYRNPSEDAVLMSRQL
jgi:ribosomal-protein-alanine N-acetyltransferase